MKYIIPVLDSLLMVLGWFASVLMAPFALVTACGFLFFTALLGAQMRRGHQGPHGLWRWVANDPQIRVGS